MLCVMLGTAGGNEQYQVDMKGMGQIRCRESDLFGIVQIHHHPRDEQDGTDLMSDPSPSLEVIASMY